MLTMMPVTPMPGFGATNDELAQMADQLSSWSAMRSDIVDAFAVLSPADRQRLAEMIIARSPGKADDVAYALKQSGDTTERKVFKYGTVWAVLGTVSMAASAYHGYKRNQSVGWALWWGFCGGAFPVITPVIAVAQGYGKRK